MIKLSVVIITYNEEKNLARCLISLKEVADEIIVADSFSTDNTKKIANSYNANVVDQEFLGFGAQKNFATAYASNDWILSLDADEALSPELRKSIQAIKQQPAFDVYEMTRLTKYCGQWIRHSGWYPDKQTRLYNRTKGKWIEKKVHEFWKPDNDEKTGLLSGDLLHYSYSSISEHLKKIEKYTELGAIDAVINGKEVSILKMLFSPFWHFFYEYFIRRGFLDGFNGYVICKLSAYAAFSKCTKIRLYSKQGKSVQTVK
ncbi:MAG: glycosyltransferase family 2 protein [Taibaiella sp.]|nr:glycosyltransferase family 2 protein [Taibaiella sp.]